MTEKLIEIKKKIFTVIVFDGNVNHDWTKIFGDKTLNDGSELHIIQTSWMDSDIVIYPDGTMFQCAPIVESQGKVKKPKTICVKPDFLIVRNETPLA